MKDSTLLRPFLTPIQFYFIFLVQDIAFGGSTTMRAAVFRAAAQELCASITGSREPSRQLGVTREFLQQTAKTV